MFGSWGLPIAIYNPFEIGLWHPQSTLQYGCVLVCTVLCICRNIRPQNLQYQSHPGLRPLQHLVKLFIAANLQVLQRALIWSEGIIGDLLVFVVQSWKIITPSSVSRKWSFAIWRNCSGIRSPAVKTCPLVGTFANLIYTVLFSHCLDAGKGQLQTSKLRSNSCKTNGLS